MFVLPHLKHAVTEPMPFRDIDCVLQLLQTTLVLFVIILSC